MSFDDESALLTCELCERIFDTPVILPCRTICKKHLNDSDISPDLTFIRCPFCHEQHALPAAGFRHDAATEALVRLSKNETRNEHLCLPLDEMKKLINYPEAYIHDYLQQIRAKIDDQVEKEVKAIYEQKEIMLSKLAQFGQECMLFKNLNSPFQDFEVDLEASIQTQTSEVFQMEDSITPLLSILSKEMALSLIDLIGFPKTHIWKLIYQGSTHGFDSSDFHAKCDGIPHTLTVIKSTSSYIFGGYTDLAWDMSSSYKSDENAFIFSLINLEHKPVLMRSNNDGFSIYCHRGYGPTFGHADLEICKNANSNINSCSNLGYSYTTDLIHGSNEATTFLAGSYNFQITDLAIYQKI